MRMGSMIVSAWVIRLLIVVTVMFCRGLLLDAAGKYHIDLGGLNSTSVYLLNETRTSRNPSRRGSSVSHWDRAPAASNAPSTMSPLIPATGSRTANWASDIDLQYAAEGEEMVGRRDRAGRSDGGRSSSACSNDPKCARLVAPKSLVPTRAPLPKLISRPRGCRNVPGGVFVWSDLHLVW